MQTVDRKQSVFEALQAQINDKKDEVSKGKDSKLFSAMFEQIKLKTDSINKSQKAERAATIRHNLTNTMNEAAARRKEDIKKQDRIKLDEDKERKEEIRRKEIAKEERLKEIDDKLELQAQDELALLNKELNASTALSSNQSAQSTNSNNDTMRPAQMLEQALIKKEANQGIVHSDNQGNISKSAQATLLAVSGSMSQHSNVNVENSYTEFTNAYANGKLSDIQDVHGYSNENNVSGSKAALAMSKLDSDDGALGQIGQNLNKINRHNLSSAGEGQEKKLSTAERIASMSNNDLRKSLDSLAREGNVSKLSLQMANPQTQAAARRDAAALANLPTSKDNLTSLTASKNASNGLLNSLEGKAVNNENQATLASNATMLNTNAVSSNSASNVVNSTSVFNSAAASRPSMITEAINQESSASLTNKSAQSTLLELTSGSSSLSKDSLANAANQNADSKLSSAINSLQNASGSLSANNGFNPYLTGEIAAPQSYAFGVGGLNTSSTNAFVSNQINTKIESGEQSVHGMSALAAAMQQDKLSAQSDNSISSQTSVLTEHAVRQTSSQLHEQVMQMSARNMKHLSVELSPEHLGKMKITIDLSENNDAVSLSIAAADPQTREVLERALPQLRDILAQQGVETDANIYDVSEDNHQGNQQQRQEQEQDKEKEREQLAKNVQKELGLS